MHTELANLWLFARAIAKLSITTGFGFGLAGMAIVHIGRTYRITGVFVGEFMGRCIGIVTVGGQRFIQIVITDTMRPSPKVFDKCFLSAVHPQSGSRRRSRISAHPDRQLYRRAGGCALCRS